MPQVKEELIDFNKGNLGLHRLIKKLIGDTFYGSLEIKFEKGNVVHCKKTESIKI